MLIISIESVKIDRLTFKFFPSCKLGSRAVSITLLTFQFDRPVFEDRSRVAACLAAFYRHTTGGWPVKKHNSEARFFNGTFFEYTVTF